MNKRKIKIGKSLIFKGMFVVSVLVIMISISYSWFVEADKSTITGITMEIAENSNLVLQGQNGEWQKNLHFIIPEGFTFPPVAGNGTSMYKAVFKEVEYRTEEGGYVYYRPEFDSYEKLTDDEIRNSVVSCDFSMQIEVDCDLCLSADSLVAPVVDTPQGENAEDGYMFAALRVAFMQKVGEEFQTKLIWIPDVTTELKQKSDGTYWVDRNGAVEPTVFLDGEGNSYTINDSDVSESTGTFLRGEDGILYVWGAFSEDIPIGELIGNEKSDFKIIIWLDGNDRECKDAVVQEKFKVDIVFNAVDKPASDESTSDESNE